MRTALAIFSCQPERSEGPLQSFTASTGCNGFSADRALRNSATDQRLPTPSPSTPLRMTSSSDIGGGKP